MAYEIYQRKDRAEDSTPISASSPHRSQAAGSPRMSTAGKATLAYGAFVGRQAYQMGVGEVAARGNEELAKNIENATRLAGYSILTAKMGPAALIPIAVNEAKDVIQTNIERKRDNASIQMENRLRSQRMNVGGNLE